MIIHSRPARMLLVSLLVGLFVVGVTWARQVEPEIREMWYFSPSLGIISYEGDEEVEDGMILTLRLGKDYKHWLSVEYGMCVAPTLDEGTVGNYGERVSTADEEVAGFGDTWGAGLFADALYHFTRWERMDPYLALGAGFLWYGEKVNGESFDPSLRVGGGVMYHFNDEWAARADVRTFLAGNDTEANAILDGGVVWTWGAHYEYAPTVTAARADSDMDGLSDRREGELGTDPYNPDTDGDRLQDGPEVDTYSTDPLNPDSDWDSLKDGDEVLAHKTDPLKRDTDSGGVADGHEVIEDGTNPLDPSDDLLLFELYIQFDYDKAIIKPTYFSELDVIGKVLRRNTGSTARIEGHADRSKRSNPDHNKRLSKQRAEAVLNYLATRHAVERSRLKAIGYGFERPKAPNDPIKGNPVNRRVEVYLSGVIDKQDMGAAAAVVIDAPPETK